MKINIWKQEQFPWNNCVFENTNKLKKIVLKIIFIEVDKKITRNEKIHLCLFETEIETILDFEGRCSLVYGYFKLYFWNFFDFLISRLGLISLIIFFGISVNYRAFFNRRGFSISIFSFINPLYEKQSTNRRIWMKLGHWN